jgi:hypothetical protein
MAYYIDSINRTPTKLFECTKLYKELVAMRGPDEWFDIPRNFVVLQNDLRFPAHLWGYELGDVWQQVRAWDCERPYSNLHVAMKPVAIRTAYFLNVNLSMGFGPNA